MAVCVTPAVHRVSLFSPRRVSPSRSVNLMKIANSASYLGGMADIPSSVRYSLSLLTLREWTNSSPPNAASTGLTWYLATKLVHIRAQYDLFRGRAHLQRFPRVDVISGVKIKIGNTESSLERNIVKNDRRPINGDNPAVPDIWRHRSRKRNRQRHGRIFVELVPMPNLIRRSVCQCVSFRQAGGAARPMRMAVKGTLEQWEGLPSVPPCRAGKGFNQRG
jgi:hypothetical protein